MTSTSVSSSVTMCLVQLSNDGKLYYDNADLQIKYPNVPTDSYRYASYSKKHDAWNPSDADNKRAHLFIVKEWVDAHFHGLNFDSVTAKSLVTTTTAAKQSLFSLNPVKTFVNVKTPATIILPTESAPVIPSVPTVLTVTSHRTN